MDFSKDLKRAINDFTNHRSVKVTFSNGDIVVGLIKSFTQLNDYDLTLLRSSTKPGESSTVTLNLNEIVEIEINYFSGESEKF